MIFTERVSRFCPHFPRSAFVCSSACFIFHLRVNCFRFSWIRLIMGQCWNFHTAADFTTVVCFYHFLDRTTKWWNYSKRCFSITKLPHSHTTGYWFWRTSRMFGREDSWLNRNNVLWDSAAARRDEMRLVFSALYQSGQKSKSKIEIRRFKTLILYVCSDFKAHLQRILIYRKCLATKKLNYKQINVCRFDSIH